MNKKSDNPVVVAVLICILIGALVMTFQALRKAFKSDNPAISVTPAQQQNAEVVSIDDNIKTLNADYKVIRTNRLIDPFEKPVRKRPEGPVNHITPNAIHNHSSLSNMNPLPNGLPSLNHKTASDNISVPAMIIKPTVDKQNPQNNTGMQTNNTQRLSQPIDNIQSWRVTAIIQNDLNSRSAVIEGVEDHAVTVSKGDMLKDFKVANITESDVIVSKDNVIRSLPLNSMNASNENLTTDNRIAQPVQIQPK